MIVKVLLKFTFTKQYSLRILKLCLLVSKPKLYPAQFSLVITEHHRTLRGTTLRAQPHRVRSLFLFFYLVCTHILYFNKKCTFTNLNQKLPEHKLPANTISKQLSSRFSRGITSKFNFLFLCINNVKSAVYVISNTKQ